MRTGIRTISPSGYLGTQSLQTQLSPHPHSTWPHQMPLLKSPETMPLIYNLCCSLSSPHSEQQRVSQLRWESSQNWHKTVSYKVNINKNRGKRKTQLRSNKAAWKFGKYQCTYIMLIFFFYSHLNSVWSEYHTFYYQEINIHHMFLKCRQAQLWYKQLIFKLNYTLCNWLIRSYLLF